jgi:hypothetical protein
MGPWWAHGHDSTKPTSRNGDQPFRLLPITWIGTRTRGVSVGASDGVAGVLPAGKVPEMRRRKGAGRVVANSLRLARG